MLRGSGGEVTSWPKASLSYKNKETLNIGIENIILDFALTIIKFISYSVFHFLFLSLFVPQSQALKDPLDRVVCGVFCFSKHNLQNQSFLFDLFCFVAFERLLFLVS